jgi:hypothetical protein
MRIISYICVLTPLEILAKTSKRVIGVLFLTGLITVSLCVSPLPVISSEKLPEKPDHQADVITVFFTGNGLGQLKPCGCSGGQLFLISFFEPFTPFEETAKKIRWSSFITDAGQRSCEQTAKKFDLVGFLS